MDEAARERADITRFAGRNREAIVAVHDLMRAGGGWPLCWPGLIAPQAWFLYRKMYLWAALVSAGPLLLGSLPALAWIGWGASALGAAGLPLYIRHARRTIAAVRAEAGEEAEPLIARAGGVSSVGAAVGGLIAFAQFVLALRLAAAMLR